MTDHTLAVAAAFQACGVEAEVLPDSDQETLILGRKLTSGKECYPCILTTGDMAKLAQRADFDPRHAAFFMPSGTGPCRFGQYHRFHRLVLDELGFPQVPIYAPDQSETFYAELGMVGGNDFARLGWQGVVAVDLPGERNSGKPALTKKIPGRTDQVYGHYLRQVAETITSRGDLVALLTEARRAFDAHPGGRPGLQAGDRYGGGNLYPGQQILQRKRHPGSRGPGRGGLDAAHRRMDPLYQPHGHQAGPAASEILQSAGTPVDQPGADQAGTRTGKHLPRALRNFGEPSISDTLKRARPYLDPSFEGEAILSMGKAKDYCRKGPPV